MNERGRSRARALGGALAGALVVALLFGIPAAAPAAVARRVGPNLKTGDFHRFTLPNVEPNEIVAAPDGNLWFTDEFSAIGRITPDGTYTEFHTPTPDS